MRRNLLVNTVSLALAATLTGLAGCERKDAPAPTPLPGPAKELTILTPHSETIREAFTQGFWNWHIANRGAPVRITWIYRGMPQCADYLRTAPETQAQGSRHPNPDVLFGGGITDHEKLAADGFSRALDLDAAATGIPAEVHGQPTRDPQGCWFATGLRSFGILCNERACGERGLTRPTTWADLADPRFQGWIAVADPSTSGSHRECLVLILQHQGWAPGWSTIIRVLANARALNARSSDALRQVESGVSLATFAVDFDGLAAAAAEGGGALKYSDPPGATAASPDVMSVLSTAADVQPAKDFVRYVLSEEGQALWAVQREHTPPYGQTLYHHAILPAVYEKYAGKLAVQGDPLKTEFGLRVDPQAATWQGQLLAPLVQAACRKGNHVRLQQAWRALLDAGSHRAALAELTAPLFDEAAASEMAERYAQAGTADAEKLTAEWAAQFAAKYAKVMRMLGQ